MLINSWRAEDADLKYGRLEDELYLIQGRQTIKEGNFGTLLKELERKREVEKGETRGQGGIFVCFMTFS